MFAGLLGSAVRATATWSRSTARMSARVSEGARAVMVGGWRHCPIARRLTPAPSGHLKLDVHVAARGVGVWADGVRLGDEFLRGRRLHAGEVDVQRHVELEATVGV